MIGWTLGAAISGKDIEVPLLVGGAACIGVSIPFFNAYARTSRQAVNLYNASVR